MNVQELIARARQAGAMEPPPVFAWAPDVATPYGEGPPARWWKSTTGDESGPECWERLIRSTCDPTRTEAAISHDQWRQVQLMELRRRAARQHWLYGGNTRDPEAALERCAADLILCQETDLHWFDNWAWLEVSLEDDPVRPLVTFPAQRAFLWWLDDSYQCRRPGRVVKGRAFGFSWLVTAWGVRNWLFRPRWSGLYASRRAAEVDEGPGNLQTLLGKCRYQIDRQPVHLLDPSVWELKTTDKGEAPDPWGGGDNVRDVQFNLTNSRAHTHIQGETAREEAAVGHRHGAIVHDEFARLLPRIQEAQRRATESASRLDLIGSTPNGRGNRFAREIEEAPPETVLSLPWRTDPRRDLDWYNTLLIEAGGKLTEMDRSESYDCQFVGLEERNIWVIDRDVVEYGDQDLPDIARGRLPVIGAMDIGHGPSATTCVLAMLDWDASQPSEIYDRLPVAWVDWSYEWERTTEAEITDQILDEIGSTYKTKRKGRVWEVYADPAIETVGHGQMTTKDEYEAAGLYPVPLSDGVLARESILQWLKIVGEALKLGLIRCHRDRAALLLYAMESWEWDIPRGRTLSEMPKSAIKWGKGRHSHLCEALWMSYAAAVLYHQPKVKTGGEEKPSGPKLSGLKVGRRRKLNRL